MTSGVSSREARLVGGVWLWTPGQARSQPDAPEKDRRRVSDFWTLGIVPTIWLDSHSGYVSSSVSGPSGELSDALGKAEVVSVSLDEVREQMNEAWAAHTCDISFCRGLL